MDMDNLQINLTGKRALVTGGNTGIGAGIVESLASAGARVVINYIRKPELAQAMVDEINQARGEGTALAVEADISREDEVAKLFSGAKEAFGGLDILVNNAGVENMYPALDMPMSEWDRILGVNLRGTFMCSKAAAIMMKEQGTGGVIINNSSIHDVVPRLGATHYCVSKAGVTMLTKVLALEWGEYGIRVVGVSPGAIDSHRDWDPIPRAARRLVTKISFKKWVPLQRVGEVEEVANAVAFLASDYASYITGTTLYIDGAYSINVVRYDPRRFFRPQK